MQRRPPNGKICVSILRHIVSHARHRFWKPHLQDAPPALRKSVAGHSSPNGILTVTTRASAPHGPPPGTRPGARALAGLFARQPRTPQRFPENVSHLRDALSQFRDTDSGNPCPPTNFPPSPHSRRQRDAHPQLSTPNPRRDGPLHALYLSPRTRSGWPGPRFHQVLPARIGSRRLAAAERAPDLGPGLLRAAARSPTAPSRSPHRRARPEACGPLR